MGQDPGTSSKEGPHLDQSLGHRSPRVDPLVQSDDVFINSSEIFRHLSTPSYFLLEKHGRRVKSMVKRGVKSYVVLEVLLSKRSRTGDLVN